MSPRLADVPQQLDPRALSPKNTFDRDPLLIPKLFSEKPWYRKRAVVVRVVAAVLFVAMAGAVVQRITMERILTKFAKVVGG